MVSSTDPYKILPYTYKRAKKLGVTVKQSKNRTKKIDVFDKKGKLLASVGARGMFDYPTYMQKMGDKKAKERRRLYKIRHTKDRKIKGTAGYYADQLLW
jgi:hypothetical protein